MILLFVGKSEIPHIFTKHFDPIRVLPSARRTADLFDSADDTQRHFNDIRRFSIYTTEMELVIRDTKDSSGGSRVGAQVGYFVRDALHSFSVQEWRSRVSSRQILIKITE